MKSGPPSQFPPILLPLSANCGYGGDSEALVAHQTVESNNPTPTPKHLFLKKIKIEKKGGNRKKIVRTHQNYQGRVARMSHVPLMKAIFYGLHPSIPSE